MSYDMTTFSQRMNAFLDDATRAIRRIAPAQLSPEKRFMNSTAAALALLIVSDGKVEVDETVAAVSFIQNLTPVKELSLERETIAFYEGYVERQTAVLNDPVKLVLEQAKILAELGLIRGQDAHVRQVVAICEGVVGAAANAAEKDMLRKIKEALGA